MNINYYKEKIALNDIHLRKLKSVIRVMPMLKIITFLLALTLLILGFQADLKKECFFAVSFMSLVIFFILQKKDLKYCRSYSYYSNLNDVYQDEINFLNGNYSKYYDGEMFVDKKHEFSYDLDIYGENSFFHRINRTKTYEGTICLAKKLIDITESADDILLKQKSLSELADLENFRFNFLVICKGFKFDKRNNKYSYIDSDKPNSFLSSKVALLLIYASITLTILTSLLAYFHYIPISIPAFLLIFQLIIPVIYFKKTNKHASEVGRLYNNISRYSTLLNLVDSEEFKTESNISLKETLFSTHNSLTALSKLASILQRFDQRENAYALVLLNMLYLSDIFLLRSYSKWKEQYSGCIQEWIDSLAEFEARISLANYIFNKPNYCLPEVINNSDILIDAKSMGHPFINEDKLVTNDFKIHKSNFMIITGANMAGKSTFLRCAGINYIMAVNGMKVCASEFQISIFQLFSSMRNTDDLSSGISYFNAELIRIEQLIYFSKKNNHTLIILDEILKGTNSKDKLKGSIMFLKEMKKLPISGIIATHDLELAKLEKEDPDSFMNYCFEISISESINYAYKIQKGSSKNFNATLLLEKILYQ